MAITVEIDTWYIATFEVPDIEDDSWHDLRVDVSGVTIRVWMDGELKIEQTVPDQDFRGGYIFFSGSTGYYTNYHRFDGLYILHDCKP